MAEKIDIGKFDRPVTFKSKAKTTDSFGTPAVAFSDFKKAYVNMEPASNDERFASERETVFSTFKVQMYYMPGLTNDMVLYTRDTLESFDIKSILPVDHRLFMELIIQKVIN